MDTIVDAEYESINPFSDRLALVQKEDKVGYIDTKGNLVIPLKFRTKSLSGQFKAYFEGNFERGYAAFSNGYESGLINKNGEIIIPDNYRTIHPFSNGLARVSFYSGGNGFINMAEEKVLYSEKDRVYSGIYSHNLFIKDDPESGRYGYVNLDDEWVLQPIYFRATNFENNIAFVRLEDWTGAIIDTLGNILFQANRSALSSAGMDIFQQTDEGNIKLNIGHDLFLDQNFDKIWATPCSGRRVEFPVLQNDCPPNEIKQLVINSGTNRKLNTFEDWKYLLENTNPNVLDITGYFDKTPIPDEIWEMSDLHTLRIGGFFTLFQNENFSRLPKIVNLSISGCMLDSLPESVFNLPKLKVLNVQNNRFSEEYKQKIKSRLPDVRVYL